MMSDLVGFEQEFVVEVQLARDWENSIHLVLFNLNYGSCSFNNDEFCWAHNEYQTFADQLFWRWFIPNLFLLGNLNFVCYLYLSFDRFSKNCKLFRLTKACLILLGYNRNECLPILYATTKMKIHLKGKSLLIVSTRASSCTDRFQTSPCVSISAVWNAYSVHLLVSVNRQRACCAHICWSDSWKVTHLQWSFRLF